MHISFINHVYIFKFLFSNVTLPGKCALVIATIIKVIFSGVNKNKFIFKK